MKKIIKLTENDLVRLVDKVLNEQGFSNIINQGVNQVQGAVGKVQGMIGGNSDRIANIASMLQSVQTVNRPQKIIVNPKSQNNNMPWEKYLRDNRVTKQELQQAKALISKVGSTSNAQTTGGGPVSSQPGAVKKGPSSVGGQPATKTGSVPKPTPKPVQGGQPQTKPGIQA